MPKTHVARVIPPKASSREYILDQVASVNRLTETGLSGNLLAERPNEILSTTASEQFRAAGYLSLLDPEGRTPEFQRAVILALQAQTGLTRIADIPAEATVGLRLGAGAVDRWVPGLGGDAPSNTIDSYLDGLWATIVARNWQIMEEVAWFPIELTRQPGTRFNKYMYMWAECWQSIFREEAIEVSRIAQTLEATLPRNLEFPDEDYSVLVAYPAINLLLHVITNNSNEFNTALEQALRDHSAYYSHPDRVHTAAALISWPILATVCHAMDNDIPIEVDSEYIPQAMINQNWAYAYEPIY
ncbi:immunity 49 family protein [Nocardia sp. NPDC050710]|uniref:immunity 49 family protein n=1 Tax=Nocardia sp. NPDC050710 TaxID=3157220 RepID=UPI0033FE8205